MMRVRVWRNLRYDCWTVYCCSTRRVLGPEEFVLLRDVTFHVSKRGRKRSLKKRWDSRHAYAEGFLAGIFDIVHGLNMQGPTWIVYNSKKGAFIGPNDQKLSAAKVAMFPEHECSAYVMGG